MTGTVRRFNDKRGYGFIETDGGETSGDIYVHRENFKGNFRVLKPGERVEFTLRTGARGRYADAVKLLE